MTIYRIRFLLAGNPYGDDHGSIKLIEATSTSMCLRIIIRVVAEFLQSHGCTQRNRLTSHIPRWLINVTTLYHIQSADYPLPYTLTVPPGMWTLHMCLHSG